MKGIILNFSIQTNSGIISGEDSQRYSFVGKEWKERSAPERGLKVDFDITLQGQAIDIYLELPSNSPTHYTIQQQTIKSEDQYQFVDWFIKCLKNYANFNGRASRKEFWFFYLGIIICNIISMILDAILGTEVLLYAITSLALAIPFLAVSARRLHDISKSGWWYLISLTIIGIILLIIWWAKEGDAFRNPYGDSVK